MSYKLSDTGATNFMKKNRYGGIDIAKGIAIMAVVVGHYLQNYHPAYMNYAFCFHVSVFFIISGYFLNVNANVGTFILKKAKRLLKPYFITGAIWCSFMTMKELIKTGAFSAAKQLIKCVYAIIFGGAGKRFILSITLS